MKNPIPYNEQTMKFSQQLFEEAIKLFEENEKRKELLNEVVKPLEKKYDKLRIDELLKLKNDKKFVTYCEKILKKNNLSKDFYETYWVEDCGCGMGSYAKRDLVDMFGSKEYKETRKNLEREINHKTYNILNGISIEN